MKAWISHLMAAVLLTLSAMAAAGEGEAETPLGEAIEDLKKEILELNRDLFVLEEELLFPANTQVAVFLSMDVGQLFTLDAVELRIDGKTVAHYLYTERELEALQRGGVQRLYLGNLKQGAHELVAFFTGKGPRGRDYRRGAQQVIEKGLGPRFIELRITDRTEDRQPAFSVREWE